MNTIAPDQTVFMTHAQMMQGALANVGQQSPGIARSTTMPPPGTLPQPNSTPHQHDGTGSSASTAQNAVNNPQQGQSLQQALQAANSGQAQLQNGQTHTKSNSRLLIYFIIALVVLIALVVVFLILIRHLNATALLDSFDQPLAFLQSL
jgi:cobalamin biosynthesis Mg chelatase CobN